MTEYPTHQELTRLRMLVRRLEDEAKTRRAIDYDVVLGEYGHVRLCGPRMLSGPSNDELEVVKHALYIINSVADRVGLRLDAVVFRKAQE